MKTSYWLVFGLFPVCSDDFLPVLKSPVGLVGEEAANTTTQRPSLSNMSIKHPLIEIQWVLKDPMCVWLVDLLWVWYVFNLLCEQKLSPHADEEDLSGSGSERLSFRRDGMDIRQPCKQHPSRYFLVLTLYQHCTTLYYYCTNIAPHYITLCHTTLCHILIKQYYTILHCTVQHYINTVPHRTTL